MHRQLWEWETDALLVEGGIYTLVHIKINIPIVGAIHPTTNDDFYTAVCQLF